MGAPFWNGISTSSISGMVRYGGTIAAAVPSNVSRKPDSSASRYGLAKRHSRSSAQVDDGAACSR